MPYRYEFLAHRINPAQKAEIPELSKHKYMELADHIVTNFDSITLVNESSKNKLLSKEAIELLIVKIQELYYKENMEFSNFIKLGLQNFCEQAESKEEILEYLQSQMIIDEEHLLKINEIFESDIEFYKEV